ncbi:MAG TPA: class I SAM-dependent methyltransferase [Povalibacter sp.]|nr:class I SAM-dependent methyltransferase [Povalibacter sp.]
MDNPSRSWETWGKTDPYFGVLTDPGYRTSVLDDAARRRFFATGEAHIAEVFATIRSFAPDFSPRRALDFGCGVGRLVLPIAARVPEVIGIDVSPSMLEEARRVAAHLPAVSFSQQIPDGPFDLVHSYIVFQHIPEPQGQKIVRQLASRLAPQGIGALQVLYGASLPRWKRLIHWARNHVPGANALVNVATRNAIGRPVMQMNVYSLNRLIRSLHDAGCEVHRMTYTDHGWPGTYIYFRKQPKAAS